MKMDFGQYCRIESKAGGVTCTPRQFIRACHSVLADTAKGRDLRQHRHDWIRSGLDHLRNARNVARGLV